MKYRTILADPPWRFTQRTGKVSPEHGRLHRYPTMSLDEICGLGDQVQDLVAHGGHLYLWVPSALLNSGLQVMAFWGFEYKTPIHWVKTTKAGVPDLSCMGFHYRNVIEPCLYGNMDGQRTKHYNVPNILFATKTGHSQKPEAFYQLVEHQSEGPYLELFARAERPGWDRWGNEVKCSVLLTTDLGAVQSWRQVVQDALEAAGGQATLPGLYLAARGTLKVARAQAQGHQWKAQIRRTLQRYFFPEGKGKWRSA